MYNVATPTRLQRVQKGANHVAYYFIDLKVIQK